MTKMNWTIKEETIGNTTIKLVKDGDYCSLVRDGKVLNTDWNEYVWPMYEELALSLYREHYAKKEGEQNE